MPDTRRKFTRKTAMQRKGALIQATLSLVAEQGVHGATVRAIAERAGVTPGLIRHYFTSKEDLISAAYDHHMTHMTDLTFAPAEQAGGGARARLAVFVGAALKPPVVDPRSIALWASFLNEVRRDAQMMRIHQRTYDAFRDRLEAMIRAALEEAGAPAGPERLRRLATACNAVIDGLWLEGGALPDAFRPGELPDIGLESVGAIIGLELDKGAHRP